MKKIAIIICLISMLVLNACGQKENSETALLKW